MFISWQRNHQKSCTLTQISAWATNHQTLGLSCRKAKVIVAMLLCLLQKLLSTVWYFICTNIQIFRKSFPPSRSKYYQGGRQILRNRPLDSSQYHGAFEGLMNQKSHEGKDTDLMALHSYFEMFLLKTFYYKAGSQPKYQILRLWCYSIALNDQYTSQFINIKMVF